VVVYFKGKMKAYTKGRKLEYSVAKKLRAAGFDSAKRMPRSGAIDGLDSDVLCFELPFVWELKNQETWSPATYMAQAEKSCEGNGKMPVVVMDKNRLPDPLVMLKLSDWILILQRAFIENKLPILTGKNAYNKHKQLYK